MTIPFITLVGLFAYVTTVTVNNANSLDQAVGVMGTTSVQAGTLVNYLESERTASMVYLSAPTAANLRLYKQAIAATVAAEPAFETAMASPAATGAHSATAGFATIVRELGQLPQLRHAVEARTLTPMAAFSLYTQGITTERGIFLSEVGTLSNGLASFQGVGLVDTVEAREYLEQEDALLSGMLASTADGPLKPAASQQVATFAQERIAFLQVAAERQSALEDTAAILIRANLAVFDDTVNATAPTPVQDKLATIESAVASDTGGSPLPVTMAQWRAEASAVGQAYFKGSVATLNAEVAADRQVTHAAWVRVVESSIGGLVGLLLTIVVTSLVGHGILRRLAGLRRSALALAEEQLPAVVSKLRRGEPVDIAVEAPAIRADSDEIGQVGQAFDSVRQTAIRAALDEAELRDSINDVFRNLARRNQSLLHRQLTVLDDMERRATDPEALARLFSLDHLTTRMRRYAEGLIILSGALPGRSWSAPVRLVDVMRAAAAEVEQYERVYVTGESTAALSGSAVIGVLHLLAELIENATTMSPPHTRVRVSGEMVGNGFAIEVEDRGLGMSAERLAELNERLASRADFNPVNSEQIGLFVVAQLAERHGISVTLRPSPFQGISAVVLIPPSLVAGGDQVTTGTLIPGAALASQHARGDTGIEPMIPGQFRRNGFEHTSVPGTARQSLPGPQQGGGDSRHVAAPGTHDSAPLLHSPRGAGDDRSPRSPASGARDHSSDASDYKGLPRRFRQASLAPQLGDAPSPPEASRPARPAPTPAEIQARMSQMQRGWQQGRSGRRNGSRPPW